MWKFVWVSSGMVRIFFRSLNWSCGMLQTAWIVCTDPAIWNWGVIHGSIGRIRVHESILLTLRRASALLLVRNWRANSIFSRGGRRRSDACFLDRLRVPGTAPRPPSAEPRRGPVALPPAALPHCDPEAAVLSTDSAIRIGFVELAWLEEKLIWQRYLQLYLIFTRLSTAFEMTVAWGSSNQRL